MKEKVNIANLLFNNLNLKEAIDEIIRIIKQSKNNKAITTKCIVFANQDVVVRFNREKKHLLNKLNENSIILPDGKSIVIASRIIGSHIKERVAGPDFMIKFIETGCKEKVSHFFLGSTLEVLQKLEKRLKNLYPDVIIKGFHSPPFRQLTEEENTKMIEMINQANPDVLWVAFGCPKQETWVIDNIDKIKIPISACVGAAFNINAQVMKRAPLILQKLGFEWLYRLFQEPKRLWKRYLFGGFIFLKLIINQLIKKNENNSRK